MTTSTMDPLATPIGFLARPTATVDLEDSLEVAARRLRENVCGVLPATEHGIFAGAVTEITLANAMASGMEPTDPVRSIVDRQCLTSLPSGTGADALRLFGGRASGSLIVLDDSGRVMGILAASDLYPKKLSAPRPGMVGGMATPFGVYLTTGTVRAGVGHLALITTGMTLFGLFLIAQLVTFPVVGWLEAHRLSASILAVLENTLPFLLFLGLMRIIPLSGIHAAEHKVVHAIERGEELVPAVVRRMPRVHPRCGTNLAVGVALFLGIGDALWLERLGELRLLLAAMVTLAFWRPLGNALQRLITTRPPNERQLAMGIRSGRELLEKFAGQGGSSVGLGSRIVNSGMLHVIAGSLIAYGITALLLWALHLPMDLVAG